MNARKSLAKALSMPAGLRFGEARRLAEAFGFSERRSRGSHRIFARHDIPELVTLQEVGGMAKPYQDRQLLRLVERYNRVLGD